MPCVCRLARIIIKDTGVWVVGELVRKYDLSEHQHRFAAWCAATAARASSKFRFPVQFGREIIEDAGLKSWSTLLPAEKSFDREHDEMCSKIIELSKSYVGSQLARPFSYGVAAKLLNCYLKAIYANRPCGSISYIHPPIDRLLIQELKNRNVGASEIWSEILRSGWSSMERDTYVAAISEFRRITAGKLWMIEEHWQGYRGMKLSKSGAV